MLTQNLRNLAITLVSLAGILTPWQDASLAWAQSARPCPGEVSPENRDKARVLLQKAYELHTESRYEEAGQLYLQALAFADEPRIRLQAGIVFLNALRLLDAYEHLSEALRCGRDVIPPEMQADAEKRLERVRRRLGALDVQCPEDGATVRFNDTEWFSCDLDTTRKSRIVVAGQYVVEVTKPGYVSVLKPVSVQVGERVLVEPLLMSNAEATSSHRRFARWQPWALAGAGALVGALGIGLEWRASAHLSAYEHDLEELCERVCTLAEQGAVQERYDTAVLENRLAVSALVVGGTALAAGLTMAFFNRPHTSRDPSAGTAKIKVAPMIAGTSAGIILGHRF